MFFLLDLFILYAVNSIFNFVLLYIQL